MDMTSLGSATPKSVIYKSESHKLAHSFPVKSGKTVLPGQLVVLNTDGTIQGFESGDNLARVIGMATNNSTIPAYQASKQYGVVEATVALKGQAIVRAASGAALTAGPVKPNGSVYDTIYQKFVTATIGTDVINAVSLTSADSADDMIFVLIL